VATKIPADLLPQFIDLLSQLVDTFTETGEDEDHAEQLRLQQRWEALERQVGRTVSDLEVMSESQRLDALDEEDE